MKEIKVQLEDAIGQTISDYARDRGLSPEEMVKYLLGNWASQFQPPPIPRIILQAQEAMGMPSQVHSTEQSRQAIIISRATSYLIMKEIRAGQFKCDTCTQPLDEQAFYEGKCGGCGAPIIKKEEEKPDG